MKYFFVKLIRKINPFVFLNPEGDKRLEVMGQHEHMDSHWYAFVEYRKS